MKIKRLFFYLICVLIGVIIIDFGCRLIFSPIFNNLSENTKAGATYKFVSHNEPAEIIILGASRANHHYVSSLMEDSLGVTVYNYGWDGRCVLYQYLCLLKAIDNGGLNTVILDLSNAQFSKEWVDDRISDLYPFYWSNDTVKKMVNEVCKKDMSLLMMSSLIQFNSQYLNLIANIDTQKGYTPLPERSEQLDTLGKIMQEKESNDYYSSIAEVYFAKIAEVCRKNDIRLIVCMSPILEQQDFSYLKGLCCRNNVECWDYSHFVDDVMLFRDYSHLSHSGALLFTNEIINRIKKL